ncbi:thioredoxin-like protein [Scheffersomyces amazonensis]|uniref:thioredoxin-like protein n=1 Tax=Scheffersomyces amazonensis TaxID=1078765 RepID=UPI00315D2150
MTSPLYSYRLPNANDKPIDFSEFNGKVVIIVNVASYCGFTPQYKELEMLYEKYSDKGLVIIGFPCNQFGNQEPYPDSRIVTFCHKNYGVNFPIMRKVEVNGPYELQLYKWLKSQQPGALGFKGIRWNFEKFIIDRHGKVVKRYLSDITPLTFENVIVELLNQS